MNRRRSNNNKNTKIAILLIFVLIVLVVLYGIYSLYFTEIKRQTMPEKIQIMTEKMSKIIQRNANSNDTEKQLDYIGDVFDMIKDGYSGLIVANGYVPYLVNFLNSTKVRNEAAHTLLFLTKNATDYLEIIISQGAIPPLLQLMHSSEEKLAILALMNFYLMVYQKPVLTNEILKLGLDKHLVELINSEPSTKIISNIVPIIINLFQNKNPPIPIESATILLPTFSKLLRHSDTKKVKALVAALYLLTENNNQRYHLVFDNELLKILINLLRHSDSTTRTSARMILINAVNNSDMQSQIILDNENLETISSMLTNDDKAVVMVALNLIRMFIHDSPNHTSIIFKTNLIPLLTDKLNDKKLQIPAAALLYFAIQHGDKEHISTLISMRIVPKFYNIFVETNNVEYKKMILHAFYIMIQRVPEDKKNIFDDFEKLDAFKEFSKYGTHENTEIRKLAHFIFDTFSSENLESNVCLKRSFFV